MKIFVTGATGFIGSHLVKQLIKENFQVVLLVRENSSMTLLAGIEKQVDIYVFDGKTENLISIFNKEKPDVVIHLASKFIVNHTPDQVLDLISSNIAFSTQLCEAMKEAGVRKIINTGTSWQHYRDSDYCPVNLYAATKQAFYDILLYYVDAFDFQVVNLELFDTYGPNDTRKKLIQLMISAANSGETLDMSPGEQEIDLCYIDDVVDAYLLVINYLGPLLRKNYFDTFSVSGGAPNSLKELVESFNCVSNKKIKINFGARPYREREVMKTWRKGKVFPGYLKKISFQEGVKKILEQKC